MSLDVNWGAISPPLSDAEKETGAFCVGLAMAACGINAVTNEAQMAEMIARLTYFDRLQTSTTLCGRGGEDLNTVAFWTRWRGVAVNVAPEGRNAWMKRISSSVMADIERATSVAP